ncbi:Na+/melibiose symporter-like transporter [Tumebacillus sp. BK434]|uniref:MFS transporter n=1 Tax=Tumebacillus sp. BK434 TaxID=2512169 RepID=UPI0010430EF2|nr:MFS transporter [Tumebacillus sp. BK434]TCP57863.1 Na+/melibiose symporter-like transporter [Tumebacillus sp. BK434]
MATSIWRTPRFLFYATGSIVNNLGNQLYFLVLPLMVYSMTHSALNMSVMAVCEALPQVLLSLFAGALVDRLSRRTVIFSALCFQAVCCSMIPILYFTDLLQVWMLYILGTMLSIGQIFLRSAEFAAVPAMFPDRKLEASAGLSSCFTATTIMGPLLAGLLIASLEYPTLLVINSLTYFAPILLCLWSRIPHENMGGVRSARQVLTDTKNGLRFILSSRILVSIALVMGLSNFADSGILTVVLFHLKHELTKPDNYISFVLMVNGLGMLVGTFVPQKFKWLAKGKMMFAALLINNIGVAMFLLPVTWIAPFALFTGSIGGMMLHIAYTVLIQESVPNDMLGRVNGAMRTLILITFPLSTSMLGSITGFFGSVTAFITAVSLSIIPLLIILRGPVFRFSQQQLQEDLLSSQAKVIS